MSVYQTLILFLSTFSHFLNLLKQLWRVASGVGTIPAVWLCPREVKWQWNNYRNSFITSSCGQDHLEEMEGAMRDGANCSLSSLSLPRPDDSQDASKRRLLLIYIHGFMGSEASFHKLPAHVHDLCTDLLSESHVVYTRIYPRYKSHGELRTAVDQFSTWYESSYPELGQGHGLTRAGSHHTRQTTWMSSC